MIDQMLNLNTMILVLSTGTVLWTVRQILPDKVENAKAWKIILRIAPVFLGVGLALIPQLRPMENIVQSAFVGGIAGSLSSTLYGFIREALGEKVKALLGSKASRQQSD
jgi:RsiW-degrading membrane proteinase PrsW (M82 family)